MNENVSRETVVSAGGVVVHAHTGKILLVNRQGMETTWSLPKGHVDEGEDVLAAAEREIYEESGVKELIFVKKLGEYERYRMSRDGGDDLNEYKKIILFLFHTTQDNLLPVDPHNPEARWVDKEKVVEMLTHQKDKEFFLQIKNEI